MVHTLAWMQSSAEPIGVKGRGSAHVACWWPLFWGFALLGIGAVILGCKRHASLHTTARAKKNRLNTRLSWLVPCLSCPVPCCFSVQKKGLGSSSGRRSVANLKRAKEQGKRRGAMGWNSVFCICCAFLERSCSFFVPWFFGVVFFVIIALFFSLSLSSFCKMANRHQGAARRAWGLQHKWLPVEFMGHMLGPCGRVPLAQWLERRSYEP